LKGERVRRILVLELPEERDGLARVPGGQCRLGLVVQRLGRADVVRERPPKGGKAVDGLFVELIRVEGVGVGEDVFGLLRRRLGEGGDRAKHHPQKQARDQAGART
jgi:hypothetical protein